VQRGRLRSAVPDGDLDEEVFRGRLGVFDEHVEVAILIEHARVEQLVLALVPAPVTVGPDEVAVRISRLGVLVEILHVGVGRRRVEIEVVLLDILAVVPLAVRQAEQPLLQDWILSIPEGEGEAEQLAVVGTSREPILAPAICARPGLVVAEVLPRVARLTVVLAHRPPLTLREIRAPFPPRRSLGADLLEPTTLDVQL
jgi:hypothetical protein